MRKAVHKICGLTDPFCEHAIGAKYPDASSIRTLTFSYRDRLTLSSTAAGEVSMIFLPGYQFRPVALATAGVVPNVTAWANFAVNSVITGVAAYRIISVGARLTCVASSFTAAGLVSIRVHSAEPINNLTTIDISSFNATKSIDIPLNKVDDLLVVCPHTSQMPQHFYDQTSDPINISAGTTPKGFYPFTIYVSGAPASIPVLSIEWIINYELTFGDNSGLQQVATPPPKPNLVLTNAAAVVTSSMSNIFSTGATKFAEKVATSAATALGTYFGGPGGGITAGTATKMILDID